MDAKDICLKLLAIDDEDEVQAIIDANPELRNPKNWHPLDNRETNFNITSNQAATGGKALTELMTNMVDAVLTKHALLKNIDPKGPKAPKTMYQAVDKLIQNLRGGRLVNADDDWLNDFAQKNLVIGVTGARTKRSGYPCYTFLDNGEGQRPEDFATTFLSFSAGNKKSIPFVQGKYNMGSSGVLRYCGRKWFKLIVSRRYDGESPWGWTLVRKRPGGGMPIAEYFALSSNKTIPSFTLDMMFPFHTGDGKKYAKIHITTGTVIKLYDYHVGSAFMSFRGSRDALNENLVESILPFRILDFRQIPTTAEGREKAKKRGGDRALGVDPRSFYGMEYLLLRSHKDEDATIINEDGEEEDLEAEPIADGEEKLPVGHFADPDLGEVSITAIPLKKNLPEWLRRSINRVFHAVNGQVQYKQSKGFLSQSCGFPALKDRVVVLVDASKLTEEAHNEVWKGDRENVSATEVGELYLQKVKETIRGAEALAKLQQKIAQEELQSTADAESNDLFQKLIDSDPTLAGLLSDRDPTIRVPSGGGADEGGDSGKSNTFKGRFSPTFLRIDERQKTSGIEIPINRSRAVAARTDAENAYFDRADNAGELLVPLEISQRFAVRKQLFDGRLTVYLEPKESLVAEGDQFKVKLALKDPAMPAAVEDTVLVRIVNPEKKPVKAKSKHKQKSGGAGQRKGNQQDAPLLGLPPCKLLTNDGRPIDGYAVEPWPTNVDGFDEHDGGIIEDLGNGRVVYKINYDNSYHLRYKRAAGSKVGKEVVSKKYILGMRVLMMGYEHALRALGKDGEASHFQDEFRRMAARGSAATVLSLAEKLPKIVDETAIPSEVVE